MTMTEIGKVCDVIKGQTGITKATPGEYPLVTTGSEAQSHRNYQLNCKAVCVPLVSATGHGHASIKRIHYLEGKFALGNILAAIVPKNEKVVDAKYLYIYLSLMKDEVLVPLMKGTANVSLSVAKIKKAEIYLPNNDRQREIVSLFEKLTPEIELLKELLEIQIEKLYRFRQIVLQLAVQGKLVGQNPEDEPASVLIERIKAEKERTINNNKKEQNSKNKNNFERLEQSNSYGTLPEGWIWTSIGQVTECLDHMRIPVNKKEREERVGNIPYYGANGRVGWINNYIFDEPLVLVVEDETFIGRQKPFCYKIFGKSWVNNHAHVLRPTEAVDVDFLNYSLAYYPFTPLTSGTTGRKKLNKSTLIAAPYKLPPLAEQKCIVEKVEQLMGLCDELETKLRKEREDSEKIMEAVVKGLLEGAAA